MADNLQITADVYANTQPAARQIKAFSDKNLNNLRINLGVNDAGLRKASNGLGQIRNDADQFTKSMAAANARVLAFGTAVSVIEVMRRSFIALIATTVNVEQALAKISVVAGDDLQKAGVSIAQLGKSIFNIARDTGQSFDTVNKATLEFQRQGIGVQESLKRTRDAMIAVRISGVSVEEAVSGLTSVLNAFKLSGLESTKVLNKLVAVDNNSAASLPDLFQGLQRVGSVSQLTGQSIDQTIASIATLQEISARGGAVVGNSLKAIFTRIYDEKSLTFLRDFGVEVNDSAGKIKPAIDLIQSLAEKLNSLPQQKQLGILKELSGLYQVNAAAALTGQAFKALNGQRSIYQKALETSTGATTEAIDANKKLSEILSSQFNTINVNVGEFLSKLGEIGVKNPLSGVLDFLIKIQGTLQNILEGSGPLDSLIQGVIKFAGGSLFSTPVIAGGAFILVKIIKDFITFAGTAFSVFTGINSKLKEESSILTTVGNKLKSNVDSVNSISNAEQRRLSLTKSATAEYAKQLALTNGISSSLGSKALTTPRFIFGDNVSDYAGGKFPSSPKAPEVPKISSAGIVASAVATRLSYPSVSGYSPPNKLNISGSLRNQSGQFVSHASFDTAMQLVIKDLLTTGKSGNDFTKAVYRAVQTFDFTEASFGKAAKAANDYANGLIKARTQLAQNLPRPAFVNQPSFLQGQTDPAISRALAFQRASNPPSLQSSGLFNVAAGQKFADKIAKDERGQFYRDQALRQGRINTPERAAQQEALKQRLQQTRINGGVTGPSSRLVGDISSPVFGSKSATGGFNPEAFKNFAFNAVLATAAIEGLTSTFRGISPGLDRFADLLSKASFAITGIIALNQIGGANLSGITSKIGAGLSGIVGGGGGLLGKAVAPLLIFSKSLLNILPGIGQIVLGLTVFNEAIRAITSTSGIDRLNLAFGGLTEEASKAKDRFNALASELFDTSGQYIGKTTAESRSANSSFLNEARVTQQAKDSGIKIDGKTPKELAEELFKGQVREYLDSTKTGGKTTKLGGQKFEGNFLTGKFVDTPSKVIDETLFNFSEPISLILEKNLEEVISKDKKSLIERLNAAGTKKIKGIDLSVLDTEDLQKKYAQGFLNLILKNKKQIERAFKVGRGDEFVAKLQKQYESTPPIAASKFGSTPTNEPLDPKLAKDYAEFTRDFQANIFESAANSIEAQLKTLDVSLQNPSLTKTAQREIESIREDLLKRALDVSAITEQIKFEGAKTIIQSQVGVNGKTQEDANREIALEAQKFGIINEKLDASRKLYDLESNSRKKANAALDDFSRITNSAQAALSNLSVARAISNQRISGLESASNNPALDIFGREGFQRQANQAKISDLKTNAVDQAKIQADIERASANNLPADERSAANDKIDKALEEQLINIQTNVNQLESANQNIGAFSNASAQLTTSLEEFRRSIGQNRAQNQFNALQATDSSSLATGLISEQVFGQAEGKSGKELVSFLADQNAILNEQFKIRTALNATEKLDLETQLALTKEILDIKTQELDPLEKQQKIEEAINKNLALKRGASYGVKQARAGFDTEQRNFGATFAKNATDGFRDGLVNAIDAATSKTADLKSTLLGIAFDFANALKKQAVQNLVNVLLGSSKSDGGSSSGGLISSVVGGIARYFSGGSKTQKKAAGGMISGGSGTKDDVPTLLMGGEYVIPKSTVQQYGLGFFEGIRNGSIGKMAQGGFFAPGVQGQGAISGNRDLLDFATQTATSGSNDVTRSLGNGAAIAALEPESLRLSNFARFGDSPIVQATQEAKDQAFGLYLDGLNAEKEYAAQQAAIKKAKKDQLNGLWTALAVAAIGGAISYGANKYGSSTRGAPKAQSADAPVEYNAQSGLYETPRAYQTAPKSSSGGFLSSLAQLFSGSKSGSSSVSKSANSNAGFSPLLPQSVTLSRVDLQQLMQLNGESGGNYNPYVNGQRYRNAGGYVGGNGDTIPTVLSNKEFVLNSSATQKLGDKNLYALNNGGTPSSGGGSDEKIIAKLDELIQKTIGASNVTVSVSMDSSGKDTSKDQSSSENSQSNQKLSQRIKDTVVSILREEQRPGGVLSKR